MEDLEDVTAQHVLEEDGGKRDSHEVGGCEEGECFGLEE